MNLKIQILHRVTGTVLFEYESENNSIKKTLEEAVKRGIDLQGANLQGANLWGANLRGANLQEAYLQGANLQGANLQRAYLQGANLWGANLQGANLWGANLRGANLQEAYLQGANLQRAYLQGANLWGANLQGAKNLKLYWHLHHDILIENLTEPLKNRIYFIKTEKPKEEIETRLRLFKKVKAKNKDWPNTREGWEKLHKKECPNCPWNGTSIFSK